MSVAKKKRERKPHYIGTLLPCQKCKEQTAQIYNPKTRQMLCLQCYEGPKPLELCLPCGMRELRKEYKKYEDPMIQHSLCLIKDAVQKYWPKIAVACSWGKDSMAILHLALQVRRDFPIFTVLTPFKPKQTLKFKDRMIKEWKLKVTEYFSGTKVPWSLHLTDPDLCCTLLKVIPTKMAVKDLDCWITGLRNTEGPTRKDYQEIEKKGSLTKINPILNWSEETVWRYLAAYKIPVNPLYKKGFRSLGCLPCSYPGGIYERDGRWRGTCKQSGECGIHTQTLRE